MVALACSNRDGRVRSAGGGFIPSRRWPRPSPLTPWQIAQLAAKMTAPATRASRELNSPSGIFGELRSHAETASEIANRIIPAFTLGFGIHRVAKALHLMHDCRNKLVDSRVDGARSDHAQVDSFRH